MVNTCWAISSFIYPPHDVDMMLSEEACKAYCVNDTNCVAMSPMTSKNDGSGLCTLKRTTFISGSTSPSIPSTSFLKVCQVPQAVAAKGANPNVTPNAKSFPFQVLHECVPDGSADKWLFDVHEGDNQQKNWQQRVDISVGVTRALMYLHTECQLCIPLGNLKFENVLLDDGTTPKLLSRDAVGDSFDQVMDKVMQDQKYLDSEDLRGVERVVRIALWCMQTQPFLRPSVGEVTKVLEVCQVPQAVAAKGANPNVTPNAKSFPFQGLLPDEMTVVAKVLDFTVESKKEFLKGVSILGGTHHRNLVSLQGFCFEPNHKVLFYELFTGRLPTFDD
ncbi:S-locus glycoprotein domain-containing protein [Artemisia annua]|uniref:S-locus glycoprotein domain-containing protein n=1 Tax=Artemisia annua TaxID=35608 RepID=A0A2U1LI27_ARTAN|nr:S-locus glycoprotein domain-containing protein [Artemisia annua]